MGFVQISNHVKLFTNLDFNKFCYDWNWIFNLVPQSITSLAILHFMNQHFVTNIVYVTTNLFYTIIIFCFAILILMLIHQMIIVDFHSVIILLTLFIKPIYCDRQSSSKSITRYFA